MGIKVLAFVPGKETKTGTKVQIKSADGQWYEATISNSGKALRFTWKDSKGETHNKSSVYDNLPKLASNIRPIKDGDAATKNDKKDKSDEKDKPDQEDQEDQQSKEERRKAGIKMFQSAPDKKDLKHKVVSAIAKAVGKLDLQPKEVFSVTTPEIRMRYRQPNSQTLKTDPESLTQMFVDSVIDAWAENSNNGFSAIIQKQAGKKFHAPVNYKGDSYGMKVDNLGPSIDKVLDAMYENTQKYFKDKGIQGVYLRRGVDTTNMSSEAKKVLVQDKSLYRSSIKLNPLSSFSSGVGIASDFGNIMIHTYIPVERILATPFTGIGCLAEQEFVVIGSESDDVFITKKGKSKTSLVMDPWDYIERKEEVATSNAVFIDTEDNANWTKKTWDLPFEYGSKEYKEWLKFKHMTDAEFKKTPTYRLCIGKKKVQSAYEYALARLGD